MTSQKIPTEEVERLLREVYRATRVETSPGVSSSRAGRRGEAKRISLRWVPAVALAATVTVIIGGTFLAAAVFPKKTVPLGLAVPAGPGAAASAVPTYSTATNSSGRTKKQATGEANLQPFLAKIDAFGTKSDPAYDTMVPDPATTSVIIYRADPVPERLAGQYQRLVPRGVHLRFAHAVLSYVQREDLSRIFAAALPELLKAGIHLTDAGAQPIGGSTVIGYDPSYKKPSATDLKPFEKYGPATVAFAPHTPVRPDVLIQSPIG
jgi:hypothetical protein